jgi:hypothetical protein
MSAVGQFLRSKAQGYIAAALIRRGGGESPARDGAL